MGSAASHDVKMITLISSDNERFEEVPEAAASLSPVIRKAIANGRSASASASAATATAGGIRLSKIPGKVLAKVLEYCNKHAAADGSSASSGEATNNKQAELIRRFDEEFIDGVDRFMLYDLLLAAYYLEVYGLVDLAKQKVADRLEARTAEIRKTFWINDDYFAAPDDDDEDEKQWLFV
ncbi:unnamed protein product [Urochloa humidicola]